MTLDCPGCHSRLKLDPAKLPPGATAAVCPKCRTKILLPGSAGAEEITVQCGQCSSRLKVKVARLKPTGSKSKCPKCGGPVILPAAPSARERAPARQPAPPPQKPAPAAEDRSAMTRRLDAREMGILMKEQARAAGAGAPSSPIRMDDTGGGGLEKSAADLGRLIDEKVDALGATTTPAPPKPQPPTPRGEPSVVDMPIEMPPLEPEPSEPAGPAPGTGLDAELAPPPAPAPRPRTGAGGAARPAGQRDSRSSSASRAVPTFSSAIPGGTAEKAKGSGPGPIPFVLGGLVGGSLVSAGLILGKDFLPPELLPTVPEAISTLTSGGSLALLAIMVVLSPIAGVLGYLALPPSEGSGGTGGSLFRSMVAAGLVGLLAGVAVAMITGGSNVVGKAMITLSWTLSLIVAGLVTGLVARIFASR